MSHAAADHRDQSTVLLAEANHRIANHLSMLCAALRLEASAAARGPETLARGHVVEGLQQAAARVEAMARLHRELILPQTAPVDLADCLDAHLDGFIRSLPLPCHVVVDKDLRPGCTVRGDQASLIVMAMGEILVNAVKYAHPTGLPVTITVVCAREGGRIHLSIADDGVGLPDDFDKQSGGGIGFALIRGLADCAQAKIDTDSSPLGLSFSFELTAAR